MCQKSHSQEVTTSESRPRAKGPPPEFALPHGGGSLNHEAASLNLTESLNQRHNSAISQIHSAKTPRGTIHMAGLEGDCPSAPRQLWSCGHQAPPSLAGHGAPEMPSLSHCHMSQRALWRSHLWATESKLEAHIRLAHLHRQLGSKAQPQTVKPLPPGLAQFCPWPERASQIAPGE